MNGANAQNGYGYGPGTVPPDTQRVAPTGEAPFEGYRKNLLSGFEPDEPRAGPMNTDRPQSPTLVDLKDPIQVHLLIETALSDSRQYEILSQEEVDDLKKEIQSLDHRVQQTKANLTIQSKYRDAAISMAKLYSTAGSKRRSLLGSRLSGGDSAQEAEMERQASERRCEELSTELSSLEKRMMDPQRRLWQHTAGILQMTHRSKKINHSRTGPTLPNGIPGSPESLYTYSNGRNSVGTPDEEALFDDRSLYLSPDQMDGDSGRVRRSPIEIPLKSPVREQNNQLREDAVRLREVNERFKADTETLRREGADSADLVARTEKQLEELNNNLHEMILGFNPSKNGSYTKPPRSTVSTSVERTVRDQLEYLQGGIVTAREEQQLQVSDLFRETERTAVLTAGLGQAERRVESFNRTMRDVLQTRNPDYPAPPDMLASELDDQLDYLQNSLRQVATELSRASEQSSTSTAEIQKVEQFETVLMGLWDIIQTGYAGIEQKKAERRKTRIEMGLNEDEDDMSGEESSISNEPYSLQAFSTKVQWLYAQATNLNEQKGVLKRQIKQQRELNSKSDSAKDLELKQKSDELQQIQSRSQIVERDAQTVQERLLKALKELEDLQRTSAVNEATLTKSTQQQLKERDVKAASLESDKSILQKELFTAEGNLAVIQTQLNQANESRTAADVTASKLQKDMAAKDDELERMNVMVVELKTEATIARAELEGAYGSRSQRAAEAAAFNKSSAPSADEVGKLRAELASTLAEFEDMTKETIAAEKEKLDLESRLDNALAARTRAESEVRGLRDRLESEVAGLQEQLDAERLKAPGSGTGATGSRAGATMLSEQFRATMKEERRKYQDEIREEQNKRRKLEDELRAMRKAQGPGKSPLGPLSPR